MSNLPSWSDASEFDSDSSGSDGRQRQKASDLSSPASAYEMLTPSRMLLPSGSTSPQAEAKESDEADEKTPAEASTPQSQQSAQQELR